MSELVITSAYVQGPTAAHVGAVFLCHCAVHLLPTRKQIFQHSDLFFFTLEKDF